MLSELERQEYYLSQLPENYDFPLFRGKQAVESQRRSGYKDTARAAREIVDNAFEAGAENVWVTGLRLMHRRTMDMEIAGHEFFGADGKTIWYDLQTPKSGVFWLTGVDLESGERTRYHLERHEWSVHFNASPDGKLFAGDGGGPASVANRSPAGKTLDPPGNGQWIYHYRPVLVPNPARSFPEQKDLTRVGYLESERLVDLSKHDYRLELNVTFTPDGKWIVFRSNMHGPTHVYAVEVEKSKLDQSRGQP